MAHEVERAPWLFVHRSLYDCRWWGSGTDVTRIQRVAGGWDAYGTAATADLGRSKAWIYN